MGNFLSTFFSNRNEKKQSFKSSHNNNNNGGGSHKKLSKKSSSNLADSQQQQNQSIQTHSDNVLLKQSDFIGNKTNQSNLNDQIIKRNSENLDQISKPNGGENPSPFQRDYYPPPHEMLVPLEKYRPRRSNVRRSARQNAQRTASSPSTTTAKNSGIPDDTNAKIVPTTPKSKEIYFDNSKETKLLEEPPVDYNDDDNGDNDNHHQDNDGQLDDIGSNDIEPVSFIDKLDPIERNKVARTKISEMLKKQQQNPQKIPQKLINRKYQSVFEPSVDYYQQFNEQQQQEYQQQEKMTTSATGANEFDLEKSINRDENDEIHYDADNHHHKHHRRDDSIGSTGGAGEIEANKPTELFIRRPKKMPLMMSHGNALLIDELKKRQSNLYAPPSTTTASTTNDGPES